MNVKAFVEAARRVFAVLAGTASLFGCALDNGLPSDLREHLLDKGIAIKVLSDNAPMMGRSGYIEIENDLIVVEQIVQTLELKFAESAGAKARCVQHAPDVAAVMWMASRRPPSLHLASGGQLEYVCLVVSATSRVFLIAEYAYG
jgi:hypothetical protein